MAIVKPAHLVSQISGSVGDVTFARNAGGEYVRARTAPHQNWSQAREDARTAWSTLIHAWSGTLTDHQRDSWRAYAHQWPRVDRWGSPRLSNGYPRFLSVNSFRTRALGGIAFLVAPPAGPLARPIVTATADGVGGTITITLPPANFDPPFTDLRLWAFAGEPVAVGVAYYTSPWRYASTNLYNGAWAIDPWTFPAPLGVTADMRTYIYVVAQHDIGGQLSTRYRATMIAT